MPDALRDRVVAAFDATYEIGAEVGRGGMGVVYRARDRRLRRVVAVKVLPPDLAFREEIRIRFLREAETAAQLNHPNIVPIYSVEEREGLVGFVMAMVEGESLAARLARERYPAMADVHRILRDVADALAYAHTHGIVHRDIKPDNILLDAAGGRPMVTDFGIARAVEGDSRLTVTGIAVGTPAYMSPEQAMGEREIDGRSDVYSLAIVGYQMLSGQLPFQASNTPSMLMKHINEQPRRVRDLRAEAPAALASVVERAMAKKPAERFPDAAAFRDAVVAAASAPDASFDLPPADQVSVPWQRPAIPGAPAALPPAPRPPELFAQKVGGNMVGVVLGVRRGGDAGREETYPEAGDRRSSGRDAVDAANAGMGGGGGGALAPIPSFMPESWREARREWGMSRSRYRQLRRGNMSAEDTATFGYHRPTEEERIRSFRRRTASTAATILMLAGINVWTGSDVPWFLFPAAGMAIGWIRRAGSLWADGISLSRVFGRQARAALARPAQPSAPPPTVGELAARLAAPDVLAGSWGPIVQRAAADRAAVQEVVARLAPADRDLIPDVLPTVDALAERVGSIALSLHRMDEDITPAQLADLERRLTDARGRPPSPERDQRVALLERQQSTLGDLSQRRDTMRVQLESASLTLQNLRLDLLALRSAGVQSALDDVSGATQEARALSKEIANVLDAAKQIR